MIVGYRKFVKPVMLLFFKDYKQNKYQVKAVALKITPENQTNPYYKTPGNCSFYGCTG
jgi:hypothetical protein